MKLKLLTILFCLIGFIGYGQNPFGAKVGVNFNSFRGNKNFDVIPGFSIGGFAKYKVLDFVSPRVELLYFQQGANLLDYSLLGTELRRENAVVRFHTIQIPVLAEFSLPSLAEEPLQPKLLVGMFYSWIFSATEHHLNVASIGGYEPLKYHGYNKVNDQFENKQFGWIIGAAAQMKMFSYPVELEFRYNHNVPQISKGATAKAPNMARTFEEWGDRLYLGTVSFNVAVTIQYF